MPPPKFQPHIERTNDGNDAWRKLDALTAITAKAKQKTAITKALEAFKPMRPDDPRWQRAMAEGDCWVFLESDKYVFGVTTKTGEKMPVFIEWAIVHTMNSVTGKVYEFRVYRHNGYWRYKTLAGVMRKNAGNRVDLLSPEGHPLTYRPPTIIGIPNPPTTAANEREGLVLDLAVALGVSRDKASVLFFQWTGK